MPENEIPLGRFCWYELLTPDPASAPGFYGAVTGWTTERWEGGQQPYTMWVHGDRQIGGIMELPEEAKAKGAPPHWLAYLSTPDVAATTARAKELGANLLLELLEVPEVGTITVLQDPQGAVIAAYQPSGSTPGSDGPPQVGDFSWNELATADWEAAWSFYSELFGWRKADAMDLGEMGTYQMFGRGAHPLGGMFRKPTEMPMSAWLHYVRVADVSAAAEKVKEAGGKVLNGPMEVPGGDLVAQCLDPVGAAFALHSTS